MYIYIYPSHFKCVGTVSVVLSPDYKPHGTGPTRRRSTCEKDCSRAEMEQEQSKRDRAREWRWTLYQKRSKAKEKESDRYSLDTSLAFWNSLDDRFAIFTAILRPQNLAPTHYTWLQQISTYIFFCVRHSLHMRIPSFIIVAVSNRILKLISSYMYYLNNLCLERQTNILGIAIL